MSLFKLTPDGDLDRGPNGVGYTRVEGVEEFRVHLYTRAQLIKGEVKRSKNTGIDLQWAVLPDTPDQHVANHLSSLYAGTPGVVDVVSKYNFDGKLGIFASEAEVTYDAVDQEARRVEHETFIIRVDAQTGATNG